MNEKTKVGEAVDRSGEIVSKGNRSENFIDKIGTVVSRGTTRIVDTTKVTLKNRMKDGFKNIFIKSSIKYVVIFIGVFLVIFEPFKFFISNLIASFLFIGILIWSIVSAIKVIRFYYKLPYFIVKRKNIHDGAWDFIRLKWPKVAKGITGYNIVRNIGCLLSKNFEDMPKTEETVHDFLKYILRDVIIFVSFFVLYFVTVNLIVKPILLIKMAGIYPWEIYLFPFVQIKEFIVYLFLKIF